MIVGSGQCDLYTAGAAALKVRGELPGRSARGRDAANPCGSLQRESQIFAAVQSVSLKERNCRIVRFFKMGLLPLTAIVPVFDQGSGRVESRRCRSVVVAAERATFRVSPILVECARAAAEPSNLGSVKKSGPSAGTSASSTRVKRVCWMKRDFPLETARYRVD